MAAQRDGGTLHSYPQVRRLLYRIALSSGVVAASKLRRARDTSGRFWILTWNLRITPQRGRKTDNARGDESKGENQGDQGHTGTTPVTGTAGTELTSDDENDSQALTGGDITTYGALVASAIYHKIQISSSRQCRHAVQTCQEDRKIPRLQAESEVLVPTCCSSLPARQN